MFYLPSHEDKNVSCRLREVNLNRLFDGRFDVVVLRHLRVEDVHGEGAPGNLEDGHTPEEFGEFA